MAIRVRCPRCGYVLSIFDEAVLRDNRSIRRAYEHSLKNPMLCAGCSNWIQRPRLDRSDGDEAAAGGDRGAAGALG